MKTAVFYDLENIGLTSKNGEFEPALLSLRQKIETSPLTGDIVLQKAYISKSHPALTQIAPVLEKLKIELVAVVPVIPVTSPGQKHKNLVDFKMNVDVVATVARKRSVTTVAMASGDKDFGFLCQQIKDMGRKLLIVSRYATTGVGILGLCDDWVDIGEQALQPKFIRKAIETRVRIPEVNGDFLKGFSAFLRALEEDVLLRRYMSVFGLPMNVFFTIAQERIAVFPKYMELGFVKLSDFIEVLLGGTNFECDNARVKYNAERQPRSQKDLIESVLRLPPGYTREELFRYYDILAGLPSIEDLLTYIAFMKRAGMLKGNALCRKDHFLTAIREHMRSLMARSGLALEEEALAGISGKL